MVKKNDRKRWAWILSRVFDPVFEIPLLLGAAVFYALQNGMRWRFLLVLLVVDAFFPFLMMVWSYSRGKISDWDVTKREQRYGLYFWTLTCHLFGLVLAIYTGKILLVKILFIFWLLALLFAVTTVFWKISVHAGVNGALVAFFNYFFGWDKYWWLIIVLLLVLWSRVEIKKHTPAQVFWGASLALGLTTVGLTLLGV